MKEHILGASRKHSKTYWQDTAQSRLTRQQHHGLIRRTADELRKLREVALVEAKEKAVLTVW
jgi:hypothetical protein